MVPLGPRRFDPHVRARNTETASLATACPWRGGGAARAGGPEAAPAADDAQRLTDASWRASAAQPPRRLRGDTGNLEDTTCHLTEDSPVGNGTLSEPPSEAAVPRGPCPRLFARGRGESGPQQHGPGRQGQRRKPAQHAGPWVSVSGPQGRPPRSELEGGARDLQSLSTFPFYSTTGGASFLRWRRGTHAARSP